MWHLSLGGKRLLLVTLGLLAAAWAGPAGLRAQDFEAAGEVFVDLDARHDSAGTEVWESQGTMVNFLRIGEPFVEDHDGAPGVDFNTIGAFDYYESEDFVPEGLVDTNCTRSIETWVYNPDILPEETMVAWGRRGGPDGTNMSFNYGSHVLFSAIGHWGGGFPDIGWGPVPPAAQWHHLVYTYDGTTTRLYQDGFPSNVEYLGPGIIDTHDGTKMLLGAQYLPNGTPDPNPGLTGKLSLGRVRVHDEVLTEEQILLNFFKERPDYPIPEDRPLFLNAPAEDYVYTGSGSYSFQIRTGGFPPPTFELTEPAGATVSEIGLVSYNLPNPEPTTFKVTVKATNGSGTEEASWDVLLLNGSAIQSAGDLLVDLDGSDPSAGTAAWANLGIMDDFVEVGDPQVVTIDGGTGVSFNLGATQDAYTSLQDAPEGIVGADPTRSIEVWAYNPEIGAEEGMVAWGHRGGPAGSNVSLNFGSNIQFGAVTHWDATNQDMGWLPNLPPAARWTHLAYTYDGQNTRVYRDGEEAAWEGLGPGQINTYDLTKITVGAQVAVDGLTPDFTGTQATMIIGRVRVHDEVLRPAQILNNYRHERPSFPLPPVAAFTATPEQGPAPLSVAFDASASTSENGTIDKFVWDFGDGETGEGKQVNHNYPKTGRYDVKLTVTDVRGAVGTLVKQVTVQFPSESVPPWTSVDIGEEPPVVMGGIRPAAGSCLEIYAGGKGITGSADQFHYAYQQVKGDASITARVQAVDWTPNSRLGVMFREDLTAGARQISLLLWNSGTGRYVLIRREKADTSIKTSTTKNEPFTFPNVWIRLQRQGNSFIGALSSNGTTWTDLGTVAMPDPPIPDTLYAGIAATSVDGQGQYLAAQATLCDITVTGSTPPPAAPTGLTATPGDAQVALNWNDNSELDLMGYNVYRSLTTGGPYTKVNAALLVPSGYTDTTVSNGTAYFYTVTVVSSAGESAKSGEASATPTGGGGDLVRRGDVDANGLIDISDPVGLLGALFLGTGDPACLEAADFDNNGAVDITDAVNNLGYQFLGTAPPGPPGPNACGPDPAAPFLGCSSCK